MNLFKKITCMRAARLTVFLLLAVCYVSLSWAQTSATFCSYLNTTCAGHEFTYSKRSEGKFYCNPLMLEGDIFFFNVFTLKSKGELKLIKGDANSGSIVEIPFYLRLRRNGVPVVHLCGEDARFSKVEISDILKSARNGDELIIEPVNKVDWPAKRIIKIVDGC